MALAPGGKSAAPHFVISGAETGAANANGSAIRLAAAPYNPELPNPRSTFLLSNFPGEKSSDPLSFEESGSVALQEMTLLLLLRRGC